MARREEVLIKFQADLTGRYFDEFSERMYKCAAYQGVTDQQLFEISARSAAAHLTAIQINRLADIETCHWHSTAIKKPPSDGDYLVSGESGSCPCVAQYNLESDLWDYGDKEPLYWMEIPAVPVCGGDA